ncbi:MAG: 6-carboxytetrahydropterin synthase QueD [Candidatus Omnitrophica bacterium]|nr:6-carboxytetrahydropterin synthase QueD [Candidatus Omnitrophota bacterium]MBU4303845.1 6-carboxytetrahydropterin synthase QueD [Candidatus Omnitrophota bacterium]MBU4419250.1 6-carboxytetrahydropterin synthase QueD [Candidatus Omnitrophota bacterium]MBU4468036.1 6-carboxytetrahydropterin synthase QueD [Candidatus Omnitrophota bacterium]MCG2707833.1 6-carboxytetrahydropterin synthase QueD [Candidatus Omnitrophota bacterium]
MYSLKVEGSFSSAHNLRGYKGKCEDLHGHNWRIEVIVRSEKLNNIGIVVDFKELKKKLNAVLEEMDHKYLNKLAYFNKVNPTSENIAKYIYKKLVSKIPLLDSVTVWENATSCATYEE